MFSFQPVLYNIIFEKVIDWNHYPENITPLFVTESNKLSHLAWSGRSPDVQKYRTKTPCIKHLCAYICISQLNGKIFLNAYK